MTEKDLKKLTRADLLEMLIDQSLELQALREKLAKTEEALQKKELSIEQAGSIAEASLQLSGIFDAAQSACEQYLENVRQLSERQQEICARQEQEAQQKIRSMIAESRRACAIMEEETRRKCDAMLAKAAAGDKTR